jgi:hypothetical protein
MGIEHSATLAALLVVFLGLVYFTFSRDVRGKAIAKVVTPAATAVACATFFISGVTDDGMKMIGIGLTVVGPVLLYRQLVYCRTCGNSGSLFAPMTRKDGKCSACGSLLGKPPNTSLERTRDR